MGTLAPLVHLEKLKVLSVAQNGLEGDLSALAELRHMEHVEIWNNHLVGEVERIFANKPKLSFLWLNNDEQYAPGEWNNLEIKPGTKRFIHKKVPQCFIHL